MFEKHFEVFLADTASSQKLHYQLRYQIYCEERGFEDASAFSMAEEQDLFDDQALHFIVRDIHSGMWVAAMRMVLPGKPFPIELLCKLDEEFAKKLVDHDVAEISRLCIKRDAFLPAAGEHDGVIETQIRKRKVASEIVFRLLYAAYSVSKEKGIGYWYFLATPALARMVSMAKIPFTPAGPACNHNGIRFPYFADIEHSHGFAAENSEQIRKIIGSLSQPFICFSASFGDYERATA